MRLPRKTKKQLKKLGHYQTKTELTNDIEDHNKIVQPRYERV